MMRSLPVIIFPRFLERRFAIDALVAQRGQLSLQYRNLALLLHQRLRGQRVRLLPLRSLGERRVSLRQQRGRALGTDRLAARNGVTENEVTHRPILSVYGAMYSC